MSRHHPAGLLGDRAAARTSSALAWALAALGAGVAAAGEPAAPSASVVVLQHCDIAYKRTSMVGVAHMGTTSSTILQDCYVRQGDRVKAGQVLGRVMDRDIRAELDLRKAEASNDIDVRVSEARGAETANRLRRSQSLQKRAYMSAEEMNAHELEAVTARLQIEQSKYKLQLAEIQRQQAEVMLLAREYVAPHDGVVVEVRKERGEAVSTIEPVFQVVDVDTIKVTGFLNLGDFWRVKEGQAVRLAPEIDGDDLPVESEVFTGKIVFVDRRIDPTTRTCRVIAEVANRDLLLASGLEARMEIFLASPTAAAGDVMLPDPKAPAFVGPPRPAPSRPDPGAVGVGDGDGPQRLADQRPTSPHP